MNAAASRLSRYRPALLSFAACFLAGSAVIWAGGGHSRAVQPIAFNHALHVQNGMNCTDCHAGVQTQEKATLPGIDTCITCHSAALTKSPEEEKIRAAAAAGQDLSWNKVTQVPPFVYFSHRRHVALAGLDCAECHGSIAKATSPPSAPFRPITMNGCIDCHTQKHARTDCDDCHR